MRRLVAHQIILCLVFCCSANKLACLFFVFRCFATRVQVALDLDLEREFDVWEEHPRGKLERASVKLYHMCLFAWLAAVALPPCNRSPRATPRHQPYLHIASSRPAT